MDEAALIDRWLEFKAHNQGRASYTVYYYRLILLKLRDYLATQGMTLVSVDAESLENYVGPYLHKQAIRPISRRVPVSAIRGFYGWLTQRKIIDDNPAAGLSPPNAGRPLPKAMRLSDAEKLLMEPGINSFIGLRDTAMIAILIGCGCRVSGLVALNEGDLLWSQSKVGTERLDIRFTEKGKKQRIVPVPLETSLLIRAYLGHPDLERIDRTLYSGDQVLFVATQRHCSVPEHAFFGEARRLKKNTVQAMISAYGESAGIHKSYCHPHALRHLYGAELAEESVDLLERQALLGHATPKTTEIYSHLATRKLREIVDKSNPMSKLRGPSHDLASKLRRRPVLKQASR